MADTVTWQSAVLVIIAAAIPAGVAWRAAVLARHSADAARTSQEESARLQRLETRVSAQKYEVYEPMISLLGRMFTPGAMPSEDELKDGVTQFQTWAVVYASDGALQAFGRMMQSTFHDAPPYVMLYLYADFVVEARKDMGDESTRVSVADVLAPRLNDLYSKDDLNALTLPFGALCEHLGWVPPWIMGNKTVDVPDGRPSPSRS